MSLSPETNPTSACSSSSRWWCCKIGFTGRLSDFLMLTGAKWYLLRAWMQVTVLGTWFDWGDWLIPDLCHQRGEVLLDWRPHLACGSEVTKKRRGRCQRDKIRADTAFVLVQEGNYSRNTDEIPALSWGMRVGFRHAAAEESQHLFRLFAPVILCKG